MHNLIKIWDEQLILNSFSKLKNLTVQDCRKLLIFFPPIMHGRLQGLQALTVVRCDSLEEIFEVQCGEKTNATAVEQLREIHLCNFPKLKHAWNLDAQGILSPETLFSVKVHSCLSLKCLFPASIARGLFQLKELEVTSCMVEEIVSKEEVEGESVRFLFPHLTSLSLEELPKLKHFYPGIYIFQNGRC